MYDRKDTDSRDFDDIYHKLMLQRNLNYYSTNK